MRKEMAWLYLLRQQLPGGTKEKCGGYFSGLLVSKLIFELRIFLIQGKRVAKLTDFWFMQYNVMRLQFGTPSKVTLTWTCDAYQYFKGFHWLQLWILFSSSILKIETAGSFEIHVLVTATRMRVQWYLGLQA
jgi:hypothetical protein